MALKSNYKHKKCGMKKGGAGLNCAVTVEGEGAQWHVILNIRSSFFLPISLFLMAQKEA